MEIRKLGDQSGVTLVLAMVVFLIATLLSMTLITGALSSVQNAARQRKEEQAYLSSVSAASLLKHYICDNGAFVRYVEIDTGQGADNELYKNLSAESQAAVDEAIKNQLPDIRSNYHLKDNTFSGFLASPDGTSLTLCEESASLKPDNVKNLITYSLCYLLAKKMPQNRIPPYLLLNNPDPKLIIKTPVIEKETTVTFKMEDESERWKLTAKLSTETTGLPYQSDLTFSCNVASHTEYPNVKYIDNVTVPGESIDKLFRITVTITEYRWTLDTASRGE